MLLDTSGLLSLCNRRDVFHEASVVVCRSAPRMITHNYVLAEFVPLAHVRGLSRDIALSFLMELLDNRLVEKHWVNEGLHQSAMGLLRSRGDKAYSLCDAVSFLLMRRLGINEALSTDRHFEQEGFVRLLKR